MISRGSSKLPLLLLVLGAAVLFTTLAGAARRNVAEMLEKLSGKIR